MRFKPYGLSFRGKNAVFPLTFGRAATGGASPYGCIVEKIYSEMTVRVNPRERGERTGERSGDGGRPPRVRGEIGLRAGLRKAKK